MPDMGPVERALARAGRWIDQLRSPEGIPQPTADQRRARARLGAWLLGIALGLGVVVPVIAKVSPATRDALVATGGLSLLAATVVAVNHSRRAANAAADQVEAMVAADQARRHETDVNRALDLLAHLHAHWNVPDEVHDAFRSLGLINRDSPDHVVAEQRRETSRRREALRNLADLVRGIDRQIPLLPPQVRSWADQLRLRLWAYEDIYRRALRAISNEVDAGKFAARSPWAKALRDEWASLYATFPGGGDALWESLANETRGDDGIDDALAELSLALREFADPEYDRGDYL